MATRRGRSWHELSFGELESTVNSIEMVQIDPGNPERVFVLAAIRGSVNMDVLLGSFDGGSSWETLAEGVEMFEHSAADPNVIFYITQNEPASAAVPQLYQSTNSGRTWVHRGPLPDPAGFLDLGSSPGNAERLFGASMTGEIVESRDAGKTWTTLAGPLSSAWTEIDVTTNGSTQLYGTTYDSGAQRLEVEVISERGTKNETTAPHSLNTYPNPSSTSVHLALDLQTRGGVTLKLYNVLGQHVSTLFQDRRLEPGHHEFIWDGRDHQGDLLPTGLYFVMASHSDGSRFTAVQTVAR